MPSSPLHNMFQSVTRRYDLLNRILTFGLDRIWRKKAVKLCLKSNPKILLDLCCGTGDLAVGLAKNSREETEIFGLDYSMNMLELAQKKGDKIKTSKLRFINGDAASIPFPDGYFDAIGISFAFRNLTFRNRNADQYLNEIQRVLKDGGRFIIAETTQPEGRAVKPLFHLYLKYFVAPIGGMLSGHSSAYRYLAYSAVNYYSREEMEEFLKSKGFSQVKSDTGILGIAGIYTAVK